MITIMTTITNNYPLCASLIVIILLLLLRLYESKQHHQQQQANHRPIGWKESISFPEWGIKNLVSKTDTGARTSAIDCENVRVRMVNSTKVADFDVILSRKDRKQVLRLENIPVKSETRVKSSNGLTSVRIRVTTSVRIGSECLHNVDFTLAPRSNMICPVLLGRDAIRGKYVVDSKHKYVISKKRLKTKLAKKHKLLKRHCASPPPPATTSATNVSLGENVATTTTTATATNAATSRVLSVSPSTTVTTISPPPPPPLVRNRETELEEEEHFDIESSATSSAVIVPPSITRSAATSRRSMIELPYQVVITFSLMLFVIMMTLLSKSNG